MATITDHGGDVLRLAGDALIVTFTGGPIVIIVTHAD